MRREVYSIKIGEIVSMHIYINIWTRSCKIKTGDLAGAEAIVAETDFLDDSPLFYFGKAALHYAKDDGVGAETWLARATRIFRSSNGGLLAPWQDTLIEFGYIKSL